MQLASLIDPMFGAKDCPTQGESLTHYRTFAQAKLMIVMTDVLGAVLNFLQVDSSESAIQFARWTRMLLTLFLPAQSESALNVMRRCLDVKTGRFGRDYPDSEVSWLFATSFQQGQNLMR